MRVAWPGMPSSTVRPRDVDGAGWHRSARARKDEVASRQHEWVAWALASRRRRMQPNATMRGRGAQRTRTLRREERARRARPGRPGRRAGAVSMTRAPMGSRPPSSAHVGRVRVCLPLAADAADDARKSHGSDAYLFHSARMRGGCCRSSRPSFCVPPSCILRRLCVSRSPGAPSHTK